MVKKFLLILIYSIFFVAVTLSFLPKKNLYFALEHELKKHALIIADEVLEEKSFGVNIKHPSIYFQGVPSLKAMEISITAVFAVNTVEMEAIRINNVAKSFIPTRVDHLQVRYVIWKPTLIEMEAEGEFGHARATYDLLEKRLLLHLKPSKLMQNRYMNTLRRLKKEQNGEYLYEQRL